MSTNNDAVTNEASAKKLDEQLAEATPANATLLEWARRPESQPPQEWWDDTTDPFAPEKP